MLAGHGGPIENVRGISGPTSQQQQQQQQQVQQQVRRCWQWPALGVGFLLSCWAQVASRAVAAAAAAG
jgi:hypothetical protein